MFLIVAQRTLDDIQHVMRIVVKEGKAIAFLGVFVVAKYGVAQTAGLTNDRHGAIAQAHHLAQAAGLKLRGHEEEIGAGIQAVSQFMIHGKAGSHLAAVLLLSPAEQVGVAGFAHAKHNQLNVFSHDIAQHVIHQIQALLIA